MKKIGFSIYFSIISLIAFSQWAWQNPLPQGNSLRSCYFIDANTGFAVGDHGTIIKTSDGGASWNLLPAVTSVSLISVRFTDANTGYIAGGEYYTYLSGIILKTTDGGANWTILKSGINEPLFSVFFSDPDTGYAVGDYGTILKTVDGGITWTDIPDTTTSSLNSVYFTGVNTGFVVGGNETILRTINGGSNWTVVHYNGFDYRDLTSIYFTDPMTGYTVGDGDLILKTIDGGTNWSTIMSGTNYYVGSVWFTDINTGYLTASGGIILKTIDGGGTWTELSSINAKSSFSSLCFTNSNNGYIVGSGGSIFKTTSGIQLNVAPSERIIDSTAGTAYFMVTSNTNWKVASDALWCNTTPSGSLNDSIIASCSKNNSHSPRVAHITISATGLDPIVVSVTQSGSAMGVANISEETFKIYPNPAGDKITITNNKSFCQDCIVSIYNNTAELVKHHQFLDKDHMEIDVSNLMRGIYLVKIQTKAGIEVQKLVIQ